MHNFEKNYLIKRDTLDICNHIYSSKRENFTIWKILKQKLKSLANEHTPMVFYSTKGYKDYIRHQIDKYNSSKVKRFNFVKHPYQNIDHIAPHDKPIFSDDVLELKNPPIRLDKLKKMSGYEKGVIKKKHSNGIPGFITPNIILIEFLPFIEDENTILKSIKIWLTHRKELTLNQVIDAKNYIKYLMDYPYRKRSKLDFLLDYLQLNVTDHNFLDDLRIKLFKHSIIPINCKNITAIDGMFLIRNNGVLKWQIYYTVYESVEYWTFGNGNNTGYIQVNHPLINKYYYKFNDCSNTSNHIDINEPLLVFNKTNKLIRQVDDSNANTTVPGMIKLESVKHNHKIHIALFLYKKRIFPTVTHQKNVMFKPGDKYDNIRGFVNVKGLRKIFIVV